MRVDLSAASVVTVEFGNIGARDRRGGLPREALLYGPDGAVVGSVRANYIEREFAAEFLDFEERRYCTASFVTLRKPKLWHITGSDDVPLAYIPDGTLAGTRRAIRRRPTFAVMANPDVKGQAPIAVLYGPFRDPCHLWNFELRSPASDVVARIVQQTRIRRGDYVWEISFADHAEPRDRKIGLASAWVLRETERRSGANSGG
jgi:hypothetical protein